MQNENYVYRLYQTMTSGTLKPITYHRRVTPGRRNASKEERQAFTAAAAERYAAVNGNDVTAVTADKERTMGGQPTRGEDV